MAVGENMAKAFFNYPTGEDSSTPGRQFFLSNFSDEDWATAIRYFIKEHFKAGSEVIRTGEVDQTLYIVLDGTFGVYTQRGSSLFHKPKLNLEVELVAGDLFGELSFLDNEPRTATIIAQEDGTVLALSWEKYENMEAEHPYLANKLLYSISVLLSQRMRKMFSLD